MRTSPFTADCTSLPTAAVAADEFLATGGDGTITCNENSTCT